MKKSNCLALFAAFSIFIAFTGGFFLSQTMQTSSVQVTRIIQPAPSEKTDCDVASFPIDINTASHAQLTDLPGIGDAIADRIITYRTENGPFHDVNDLIHVSGIGEKKMNALLPYITTGGTSNENTGS